VDGNRRDGSGLGLAIVREIAERHGATVEFGAGLNGRGLRVEVRFPPAV
jgi:signal transduction histidine kinase